MLCARQTGKSTTAALMALHQALYRPGSLVLLLSPSQRQSGELFRRVRDFFAALGEPASPVEAESALRLELANGSRVVSLPGKEATALAILERQGDGYHCRHLQRYRLGTKYPAVVDGVRGMLRSEALADRCTLVLDFTGVGVAVLDTFRGAGLSPVAVTIHGGDRESHEGGQYRVPKRDLVGVLQVLLQNGRLEVRGATGTRAEAHLPIEGTQQTKIVGEVDQAGAPAGRRGSVAGTVGPVRRVTSQVGVEAGWCRPIFGIFDSRPCGGYNLP